MNLYAELAKSTMQVGVFSTAIFEGLAFGLPTYLVDLPGLENMQTLLDRGLAHKVRDPGEIDAAGQTRRIDREWFFRRDSLHHFREAVRRITGEDLASAVTHTPGV